MNDKEDPTIEYLNQSEHVRKFRRRTIVTAESGARFYVKPNGTFARPSQSKASERRRKQMERDLAKRNKGKR